MFTLKQDLGCPRRMTVYAIFDILDRLKSSYDQVMTGDIQAQVSVFGKECLCAFAVTESSLDTSILHITLLQPISDMTKEDEQRCLPIRKHRGAREKRYSFGYAVFLILALMK